MPDSLPPEDEIARLRVENEDRGASPAGSGSQASPEAPLDLRPEGFDPSRMRQRLAEHGPLVLDEQVNPADVEAQCVSAVVLAYDARGNDAIVHLPATFVHWLIQQNDRTLAWAKDEQAKRHRAEEQRTNLRSQLATVINHRKSICGCGHCAPEITHASDCAVHNEPALPAGTCNCGAV